MPKTSQQWRTNSHLIVSHPSEPLVSMQRAERGWVLPSVTVEGHQAPFDAEHGDVAHVREDVRRELEVDATALNCLYVCTDRASLTMDAVYAVEIHGCAWRMPDGARWVGGAELGGLEMAFPEHRAPLVQHLEEAESGDVPERRPRWARLGWHAETVDWISSQVERLGYQRTGDVRQRKMWGLSAILEVPTDQRMLFFKEACRSPLFADEPAVTGAFGPPISRHGPAAARRRVATQVDAAFGFRR